METRIQSTQEGIAAAVERLRAGDVIAFPTETVYGLGADARSAPAVQKIYDAKGRPAGNPVIVHVATLEAAKSCAATWPDTAETLAKHFWPGPLTLILPRSKTITPLVSAGRHTVALRIPNHPIAQQLLQQFAGPIAAPSANRSGFTSPTTAAHVMAELAGRVPLIVDGGASEIGLESTVIDLSTPIPTILRPGAVTLEMLQEVVGEVHVTTKTIAEAESSPSPGLHSRHYAPRHPAYRFPRTQWPQIKPWAQSHTPLALLTHADEILLPSPHETIRLPESPADYARVLYAALRKADNRPIHAILVLEPDTTAGIWAAIHDRLHRATLPLTL